MEKLFDTHAHYFDKKFEENFGGADAILQSEDFGATVGAVVNIGTGPEINRKAVEQAAKYDFMYAAVGTGWERHFARCSVFCIAGV